MMATRPVTLLMTATIAPDAAMRHAMARTDERRAEYLRALRHYRSMLGRGLDRIVFVDNSDSDLGDFRDAFDDARITLYSYQGVRYPASYGYGYGEMALIQHAMDALPVLSEGVVLKVTGRYIVSNLRRLPSSAAGVDLAVDIWNRRQPWLDMRVMMWTQRGFDVALRDTYALLRDDVNQLPPEMILARHVLACRGLAVRAYLFTGPVVHGRRGKDGKDWGRGSLAAKRIVRSLTRPLVRALGLYPGAALERTGGRPIGAGQPAPGMMAPPHD